MLNVWLFVDWSRTEAWKTEWKDDHVSLRRTSPGVCCHSVTTYNDGNLRRETHNEPRRTSTTTDTLKFFKELWAAARCDRLFPVVGWCHSRTKVFSGHLTKASTPDPLPGRFKASANCRSTRTWLQWHHAAHQSFRSIAATPKSSNSQRWTSTRKMMDTEPVGDQSLLRFFRRCSYWSRDLHCGSLQCALTRWPAPSQTPTSRRNDSITYRRWASTWTRPAFVGQVTNPLAALSKSPYLYYSLSEVIAVISHLQHGLH